MNNAGMPKESITFKTKPQIALEMVGQVIAEGVFFLGFVGV